MKNSRVQFKFSRASGSPVRKPSTALRAALRQLAQSDEMKSFVSDARAHGRKVQVQVFHAAQGHPVLIHLHAVPPEAA